MRSTRSSSPAPAWLAAVALAWAGCASTPLERLRPRQYFEESRYTQDRATALAATRSALVEMGFVVDFGREEVGRLEMVSRPLPGSAAQTPLQRRAVVAVTWTSEGMSLVRVGFWDESEDPSHSESVPASGRLIRGGALYEAFWARLDRALPPDSSLPVPEKQTPR